MSCFGERRDDSCNFPIVKFFDQSAQMVSRQNVVLRNLNNYRSILNNITTFFVISMIVFSTVLLFSLEDNFFFISIFLGYITLPILNFSLILTPIQLHILIINYIHFSSFLSKKNPISVNTQHKQTVITALL